MKLDPTRTSDYAVMAAMRGPDSRGTDILKWVFAARIRFFVGIDHNTSGAAVRDTPELDSNAVRGAALEIVGLMPRHGRELRHYLAHVHWALKELDFCAEDPFRFPKEFWDELQTLRGVAGAVVEEINGDEPCDFQKLLEILQPLEDIKASEKGGLSET